MIADVATALSTALSTTVYYGILPDAEDGSLDSAIALLDYQLGSSPHDFGEDLPAITYYGIEVRSRAANQTDARAAAQSAYEELLGMGFLALCPPVTLGKDGSGRFCVSAQVRAHEVRS